MEFAEGLLRSINGIEINGLQQFPAEADHGGVAVAERFNQLLGLCLWVFFCDESHHSLNRFFDEFAVAGSEVFLQFVF